MVVGRFSLLHSQGIIHYLRFYPVNDPRNDILNLQSFSKTCMYLFRRELQLSKNNVHMMRAFANQLRAVIILGNNELEQLYSLCSVFCLIGINHKACNYKFPFHLLQARNKEQEQEVLTWIENVLGEKLPNQPYEDVLRDGVVLCNLINKISPGSVKKIQTKGTNFQLMENIQRYLTI